MVGTDWALPWVSWGALTRASCPQLKEHPEKGVYVKGLSMHTVHSVGQCERIMEAGWKNRSVGYAQGVSGPSSSCVWNPRVFAD